MLVLFSCSQSNYKNGRVRIANFSIGDKIDTAYFSSDNRCDSTIVVNRNKLNTDLRVFTWHDTIVWLGYSFNSKKEFVSTLHSINSTLNLEPEYIQNGSRSGMNYKGNEFFWIDSITGDEISMLFYVDSLGVFKSSGYLENNDYVEKLVPRGPRYEIKFIIRE